MADSMSEDALVSSISNISDSISIPSDDDIVQIAREISCRRLQSYIPREKSDDTEKVLNAFIEHLPLHGRKVLRALINEDADDEYLSAIVFHLITAILIPMKTFGERQPKVSDSPIENALEECESLDATMLDSPSHKDLRSLKFVCLRRDNHRCVLSEAWDYRSAPKLPNPETKKPRGRTVLAHIISFSLGEYVERSEQEIEFAKKWVTIRSMFPEIGSFVPDYINEPYIALTMLSALHDAFGNFQFSFSSTETKDRYEIETYGEFETMIDSPDLPKPDAEGKQFVQLVSHSGEDLPRPELLNIHAAIARILHASGKGEHIDRIMWDQEYTRCLASDGSTDTLDIWIAHESYIMKSQSVRCLLKFPFLFHRFRWEPTECIFQMGIFIRLVLSLVFDQLPRVA